MIYGTTHCPYCERPLATDADYGKYQGGEDGGLCWAYPHTFCEVYGKDGDERVIELLKQRDQTRQQLGQITAERNAATRAEAERLRGELKKSRDIIDRLVDELAREKGSGQ